MRRHLIIDIIEAIWFLATPFFVISGVVLVFKFLSTTL